MNMQINHAVANRLKLVKLKIEQCNAPKIPSSIYCSMLWYSMLMYSILMYGMLWYMLSPQHCEQFPLSASFSALFFRLLPTLHTLPHTAAIATLSLSLPHSISLRLCSSLYSRFSLSLSLCCIKFGFLAIVALSVAWAKPDRRCSIEQRLRFSISRNRNNNAGGRFSRWLTKIYKIRKRIR